MIFTIVTIIFLLLSFIVAMIAIDIEDFPRTAYGQTLSSIGFAISIPLVVLVLALDDVKLISGF